MYSLHTGRRCSSAMLLTKSEVMLRPANSLASLFSSSSGVQDSAGADPMTETHTGVWTGWTSWSPVKPTPFLHLVPIQPFLFCLLFFWNRKQILMLVSACPGTLPDPRFINTWVGAWRWVLVMRRTTSQHLYCMMCGDTEKWGDLTEDMAGTFTMFLSLSPNGTSSLSLLKTVRYCSSGELCECVRVWSEC